MQNYTDTDLYSVMESEGQTSVFLRPVNIKASLDGKLSDADINKGMDIVNDTLQRAEIRNCLINGCCGNKCPICDLEPTQDDIFRAIPNGNQKAKVMFVNKVPTQYETLAMLSHCDRTSVFLSLILSKINVDRNDVYFTDIVKCLHPNDMNETCLRICIETYLLKEIMLVRPKVIVFNGTNGLKTLIELGYVTGLQGNVSYGTIYDVVITGVRVKIMAMFDLDKVLQKTGDDYAKCKTTLWTQILTAFKATENGG